MREEDVTRGHLYPLCALGYYYVYCIDKTKKKKPIFYVGFTVCGTLYMYERHFHERKKKLNMNWVANPTECKRTHVWSGWPCGICTLLPIIVIGSIAVCRWWWCWYYCCCI